jgi:MoaA/NifB/PqqE/SkfB family radical SAM enzyme
MAFELESYLSSSIEKIIKNAIRASLKKPHMSLFLAQYALSSKVAKKSILEQSTGTHIPPFLIASITNKCNLYCKGCYSRANNTCNDTENTQQLDVIEWSGIFQEATELGIGFILLAGGEPLIRKNVIKSAAKYPSIIFPIFTNGTMIDETYMTLFHKNRNLLPVLSIEGDVTITDTRRGSGIYQQLMTTMDAMHLQGIFYGRSITVSMANIDNVTSTIFLDELYTRGCKLVVFVE